MLVYFWRMSHDPAHIYWMQYGWTVFFDCGLLVPFMMLCLTIVFTREKERSFFDKQFLFLDAVFTGSLIIGIVLQYFNLIQHTYGYQICIAGIILATILITISALKHGYYTS